MPRINRIRIANVSYGSKYILDQTINSFDGENVLINLSNGGGKSVLTQMFLQPILPLQKVHKRNVDSYLSTQGPTFAMIEWKLDNKIKDTYFLTGIVIHKTANDDNNERVKYFTFINEYQSANLFDISHIDFIINEEGFTKYKSYEYCLKTLREQERENSKIRVFNSDERKDYYQILEEHGIFKDEWKILAKTNEKEGGIDDMFENCQTSDDVINHWVLKNISSNLANSEKLNEMFSNLIEDIIQKEDIIARKEVLDNFSSIANSYIEDVKTLLNAISEENEIVEELEKIYMRLQAHLSQKENEIQNIEREEVKIKEELDHIEYEELSEEIHKLQFDLEQKVTKADAKSIELSENENIIKQIKNTINILNAAKIYMKLNLEKEKLYIAQKRKKELETEITNDEKYNLEYSLKKKYEEKLQRINEELDNLEIDLKSIEDIIINNKKRESDIQNKINENQKDIGRLGKSIEDFKNNEINIKQKLKLNFSRNILGELDNKEIDKILENYKNDEAEYLNIEENLKNNIKQEEENQTKYKENKINLEEEIEIKSKLLENVKRDYEEYKTRELEVIEALESISINKERLFDKEENLIEIKRLLENVEKRSTENILMLNKFREEKTKLENGEYHVDFEFGKILEKNKIQYETGESYLNAQSKDYVETLLKNNPMLPYSYIIFDEKDYEKIIAIKTQFDSNKVIPIILLKNIEKLGDSENRILNANNIYLACFYNKEVFELDSKLKLIENLSKEIENLEESNKYDKIEMKKMQNVISKLESFDYLKDSKRILEDRVNNIKETVENKKQEKEENEKNIDESLKIVENLKNKILANTKSIENNRANKKEFEDFILEDERHKNDLKEKAKLEKENINLNDEKESLKIKNDELNKEKENKKIEKNNKENQETKIKDKYVLIANAKEATILEVSIETLEKMYEDLKYNFSVNENEILKNIEEASQNIDDYEKELEKYSQITEYEKVEYSEEKLDLYEEELEKKMEYLEKCKTALNQINIEKSKVETKLNDRKSRDLVKLKKEEPLELKEIKGRYEERRRYLKQKSLENDEMKKEINQSINNIREETLKVVKFIEKEECEKKYIGMKLDLNTFNIQQINTSDLAKKLEQKRKEISQKINKLKKNYNDIYNENNGKDQAVDNILKNMDSNSEKTSYEDYYFVFERTVNSLERLGDMIQAINSDIMHIEDDKTNFKRHAFMQGKNIYLEMKSISDSTSIKLQGKSRKIPLMEIILPKELDQYAEERINAYIEKCISDLREESRISENPKIMIEKKIKTLLSDRELLNKVINAESIDLKLYKIDINEENSGLKRWKDVIIENSGGEKVISCLILVLALMQYSRRKVLERYGENENKEMSKIFIIDNPFGKMSSPHLLNGLTMILDKFNVQAICLSDLSQSSITNQFNLIYQMSLKTALYANNAYLTVDKIINDSNLKNNSVLEHIFMKTENQIKLWE